MADTHSFSVDIAAQEGLIEAILLQHIYFLQTSFLERDQDANTAWVRRSVRAYHITYPYLTDKKISGALDRMEDRDLIRSRIDNKVAYDRTKSVQLAKKGWAYFRENAFDKKENGKDEKENGFAQNGESLQGSYSSFVDSFIEGERTPPAPNPSNIKEEKKENDLVAPAENTENLEAEIPPSKKVAPNKVSPGGNYEPSGFDILDTGCLEDMFEDEAREAEKSHIAHFEVAAIASPTDLPGVTIVEAANRYPKLSESDIDRIKAVDTEKRKELTMGNWTEKKIQPWEFPNPQSPKELKATLLRYADQNPENWRDNVLESGRATNWPAEKVDECLTDFCAWQFQQDSTKGKLSQYTAGFSLWLKRQPRYDSMNSPKDGAPTRGGQTQKANLNRLGSDPAKYQEKPLF